MQIPLSLKTLSELFDSPIYIVGGYVRDSYLGFNSIDIDICGSILPSEMQRILQAHSRYKVDKINEKLGTLCIKDCAQDCKFEYTAFREEYYNGGEHVPKKVTFITDIKKDAMRRDFTINAIYYDIKNKQIVDPLCGLLDLKSCIIRTCDEPKTTFGVDGLRLMRLCRFAASLGFDIEENTEIAAKRMSKNICDIKNQRIQKELELILHADTKYNVKYAHFAGVNLLNKIGVLQYIIPELVAGENIPQRADYHAYDVFNHSLHTLKYSDSSIRLAALLHDIGKPFTYKRNQKMIGHDVEGEKITMQIMRRLCYPTKYTCLVARLVKNHMVDLDCNMSEEKVRVFIVINLDIFEKLLLLKNADYRGGGLQNGDSPTTLKWKVIYEEMKKHKTPMSYNELKLSAKEIIEYFSLSGAEISQAINKLFIACVKDYKINESKEKNIAFLKGVL